MRTSKKIFLTAITLAASVLQPSVASATAIPGPTLWISETAGFDITSTWIGATRYPYGNSQSNQTTHYDEVSLNGFDSSLGKLTSVNLFFNSEWHLDALVSAYDSFDNRGVKDRSQGVATSELTLAIDLVNPDGGNQSVLSSLSRGCQRTTWSPSECVNRNSKSGSFSGSLSLVGLLLDDFTDTALNFRVARTIKVTASSNDRDSRVFASSDRNNWWGSVTAQYHYKEHAQVPEPASLALMSAGLLAMRFRFRPQRA